MKAAEALRYLHRYSGTSTFILELQHRAKASPDWLPTDDEATAILWWRDNILMGRSNRRSKLEQSPASGDAEPLTDDHSARLTERLDRV